MNFNKQQIDIYLLLLGKLFLKKNKKPKFWILCQNTPKFLKVLKISLQLLKSVSKIPLMLVFNGNH